MSARFRLAVGQDRPWLVVMALMAAIELGCWAVSRVLWAAPVPFLAIYLPLGFLVLAATAAMRTALRPRAPHASWSSVICGATLAAIAASLLLPLKYAIPRAVPFWLDLPLASAERIAFGGDPWRLLDRAMGWATGPIDLVYGLWLPVQLVLLFAVMLEPPSMTKSRVLMAYSLAWLLLGVVAATVFSSVGPIFFDRMFGGSTFAPLHEALRDRGAWVVLAESDRMWSSMATGRPGFVAGISALPSMHVAISVWIVLTSRALAPRLTGFALFYAGLVGVGSVQLGWHYVSDGVAGALGMLAIWGLAGGLERVLEPPRPLGDLLQAAAKPL